MAILLFKSLEEKEKAQAIENLISESSPRQEFFFMVSLAVLMATFGLLLDSAEIVIGSMLIAPLLYPLLSFSLGIALLDIRLIIRSFGTLIQSILLAIALSAVVTFLFSVRSTELTEQILSRATQLPSYMFLAAIIAGFAGSYAYVRPTLNEHLPGIAISVALIPPLAIIGIGVALLDFNLVTQALTLFGINIIGVTFASAVIFSMMRLAVQKKVAEKAVKKEDKAIEKEIEKAEKSVEAQSSR